MSEKINFESNKLENDELKYTEPIFCKKCYTKLQDFLDTGFLGCEECYKTFKTEIEKYINSVQYSNTHKGKICFNQNKTKTINDYERELRQAITEQRFEDCLILKNKIIKLKEEQK